MFSSPNQVQHEVLETPGRGRR